MNFKKAIDLMNAVPQFKKIAFFLVTTPPLENIYRPIYLERARKKAGLKKLEGINVEPLNVCNGKCVICPYTKMKRKKTLMSHKLYKKIVDDCADNGIKNISLTFYNEPLLDPYLFKRIKYAKERDLSIGFFSNGTLLKGKIEKILKSGLDHINFSFDGASKETYEKIRRNFSFETVQENIMTLIKERNKLGLKKPKINLIFVLCATNFHERKKFVEEWDGCVDSIEFGIADNRNKIIKLPRILEVKKSRMPYPCPRLFSDMMIMSNGKVALCCIDYDGKIILGDLNKQSIMEVWNGEKYEKIRKMHLEGKGNKIRLCKNCDHLYRHSLISWWV